METPEVKNEDIQKNKELAALSYLWLFSVVIHYARRDSEFIQFHTRQAITLFIFSILLWPLSITRYGEFVILALMILGFIEAAAGHTYRIPVIADIAEGKFGWDHLRKAWHHTRHTAIKLARPDHVTPEFKEKMKNQSFGIREQHLLHAEEKILELEEKKLSSLYHRVAEDEKHIQKLEEDVKNLQTEIQRPK